MIHGFDSKVRFAMNFGFYYKEGGERVEPRDGFYKGLHTTSVSVGSTYMMGGKIGSGRLMVNVLGLNLGYLTGNDKNVFLENTLGLPVGTFNNKTGNSFLVGIDLPLGTQYIFDNGFSIGFSHRLDFALGGEFKPGTPEIDGTTITNPATGSLFGSSDNQQSYLAYNLTVSVGYVFGK